MTSKKLLLAGLIAAFGLAGSVQAAVIEVKPTITAVLNPDFSPVDPAAIVSNDGTSLVLNPGAKYLLQVDINLATEAGGQFGNAAFNIAMNGLTQSADLPGWQPDTSTVDKNGNLPGGVVPKWADNGDFGSSGSDLQSIIIGTAPKDFGAVGTDPRRTLGDGAPAYAGSLYLEISPADAGTSGGLTLDLVGASAYDASGNLATIDSFAGGSINYSVVPEPSALALLGLGSALLVFARKRR